MGNEWVTTPIQMSRMYYGSRRRRKDMKHLDDVKMGYWEHWLDAMKMSLALFIHAWIPSLYTTYVSDKLKNR